MKVKIYNEPWVIKEVGQEELQKLHEDIDKKYNYWGSCDQYNNILYILKSLGPVRKRKVLIHEVTHAMASIYMHEGTMDEEEICNFVSGHYDEIGRVVKEYLAPKPKRKVKKVEKITVSDTTLGSPANTIEL